MDLEDKLLKLWMKGNIHDFSKILKVLQYSSVVVSEYNLTRFHMRGVGLPSMLDGLIGGHFLTSEQITEFSSRYRVLGSALSNARRAFRLLDFVMMSRPLLRKIKAGTIPFESIERIRFIL